jgi:hypothetical protein
VATVAGVIDGVTVATTDTSVDVVGTGVLALEVHAVTTSANRSAPMGLTAREAITVALLRASRSDRRRPARDAISERVGCPQTTG